MEVNNDEYLFVDFAKYCKTCKHTNKSDLEEPCRTCIESPANLHSEKPIKYEEK
jgi:hypothetical protein